MALTVLKQKKHKIEIKNASLSHLFRVLLLASPHLLERIGIRNKRRVSARIIRRSAWRRLRYAERRRRSVLSGGRRFVHRSKRRHMHCGNVWRVQISSRQRHIFVN